MTSLDTTTGFISGRQGWVQTRSAGTIITRVLTFDQAKALAILVWAVTLFFCVSVFSAVSTNPEDWAIPEVVRTRLAPSAVSVGKSGRGVNVKEVSAEFAVRNEECHVVVVT